MPSLLAPAKINVGLRILGRREDGFHDLETLFLAVGLFDRLHFAPGEGAGFELTVEGADVGPVEENLVLRAAHLFREETGSTLGGRFRLEKRIPAGAGLGGGSSDAGAALRLLDHSAGTRLPPERLAELGGRLGADVAFFAAGYAFAAGTGRGERLTRLTPPPSRPLVIGVPPVHVATGPAYGALARRRAADGGRIPPSLFGPEGPPPVPSWTDLAPLLVNDFEAGVSEDHPEVARLLEVLRAPGDADVLLSGSGGAAFAFVPDLAHPDPTEEDEARTHAAAAAARVNAPGCTLRRGLTLTELPAVEP